MFSITETFNGGAAGMFTNLCRIMTVLSALGSLVASAAEQPEQPFVGVWRTTSASTTFLIDIHANETAFFVLIDGGTNSCARVTWKKLPGGILVESVPRLRFWKGRHADEARVEMESLPPELTSRSLQQFPLTFMMRRDEARHGGEQFKDRPLPAGWNEPTLPENWDEMAGTRRSPPEDSGRRDSKTPQPDHPTTRRRVDRSAKTILLGGEFVISQGLSMVELPGLYEIRGFDEHTHRERLRD